MKPWNKDELPCPEAVMTHDQEDVVAWHDFLDSDINSQFNHPALFSSALVVF